MTYGIRKDNVIKIPKNGANKYLYLISLKCLKIKHIEIGKNNKSFDSTDEQHA